MAFKGCATLQLKSDSRKDFTGDGRDAQLAKAMDLQTHRNLRRIKIEQQGLARIDGRLIAQLTITAPRCLLDELSRPGQLGAGRLADAEAEITLGAGDRQMAVKGQAGIGGQRGRRDALRDAFELYKAVLRADPANVYAANGMGAVLAEQGRLDKARALFTYIRERWPDAAAATTKMAALTKKAIPSAVTVSIVAALTASLRPFSVFS